MTTEEIYRALVDHGVTPEQAADGVRAASAAIAPVHVIDQAGQPYGSVRRCCNMCGAMDVPGMRLVRSTMAWRKLPREERCSP